MIAAGPGPQDTGTLHEKVGGGRTRNGAIIEVGVRNQFCCWTYDFMYFDPLDLIVNLQVA